MRVISEHTFSLFGFGDPPQNNRRRIVVLCRKSTRMFIANCLAVVVFRGKHEFERFYITRNRTVSLSAAMRRPSFRE